LLLADFKKGLLTARLTFNWILELVGNKTVRNDSERGQIGVTTRVSTDGCTMGPPADSEYAVDPVGVDMINPSAIASVRYWPSTKHSTAVRWGDLPLCRVSSFITCLSPLAPAQ
jgi:hypothetical protein